MRCYRTWKKYILTLTVLRTDKGLNWALLIKVRDTRERNSQPSSCNPIEHVPAAGRVNGISQALPLSHESKGLCVSAKF